MYSLGLSLYKKEYEYNYATTDGYDVDTLGGAINAGREFMRYFYALKQALYHSPELSLQ